MRVYWDRYILGLNHCGFNLSSENEALLWSWNVNFGQVTTKLAYSALSYIKMNANAKWWNRSLWKNTVPLNIKLCICLCWRTKFLLGTILSIFFYPEEIRGNFQVLPLISRMVPGTNPILNSQTTWLQEHAS